MNLKDFTKNTSKVRKMFGEDITPADLKRIGASEPQIYMHKDGKTIMVPKSKEQEYAKQGYQKSSLKAEDKVNERMPASIIKHKVKLGQMSDAELADRFKDYDEKRLRQMAWRHGYGKMSPYYWDRVQAGRKELDHREISDIMKYETIAKPYVDKIHRVKEKAESLIEDYAKMTKDLIIKLVKQGKTDDEIQKATGETGLRIRLIRKSVGCDKKEEAIKIAEENARRDFMKKAATGVGAVALGTVAPSVAWPDEPPENFDFMDQFFSDKILNDPKYKEFKLKGNDFLNMMKDLEKKWDDDKNKNKDKGSIEV